MSLRRMNNELGFFVSGAGDRTGGSFAWWEYKSTWFVSGAGDRTEGELCLLVGVRECLVCE